MFTPTYRSILRDSWSLTMRKKSLWFFGLFAGIAGTTVAAHALLNFGDSLKGVLPFPALMAELVRNQAALFGGGVSVAQFIAALLTTLFMLALSAFLIYLAVASLSVIIQAAVTGKKGVAVATFWYHGVRHFWPLFALVVARAALTTLALVLIAAGADSAVAHADTLVPLLYLPYGVVLLGAVLLVTFISVFAAAAIVLDEERLSAALRKGWVTFTSHWLVSIEVTAILFLIELLALLVFFGVAAVIAGIGYLFTLFALVAELRQLVPWLLGALFIVALSFILWVQAVVTTFEIAAWTKLYVAARKIGMVSRLVHIFHRARHLTSS